MSRSIITPLMAIAVLATLSGCAETINPWLRQFSSASSYPSRPEVPQAYPSPKAETAAAREKASAVHPVPPAETSAPAAAAPVKEAAPVATSVTLADEEAQKSRTKKLLDDSDMMLAGIDRSRLGRDDASIYQQAEGLIEAARKALEHREYLLASGLAEKASVLANTIVPKAH